MDRGTLVKRGVLGTLAAAVANVLVLYAARAALDIPDEFAQLRVPGVVFLTVVGGALATLAYALVEKRSDRPAPAFVKVAAVALVLSWVPDVLLAMSDRPGVTTTGVGVLAAMHVVAAVILVAVLTWDALGRGRPRA